MKTRGGSPALVSEYRYNGYNFLIGKHYDVTDNGAKNLPDGVTDSNDPWFYFCNDERWRIVATARDIDTSMKERFVYHNAGPAGGGGSSYIDDMAYRDRDADTAVYAAADGTLEERRDLARQLRRVPRPARKL